MFLSFYRKCVVEIGDIYVDSIILDTVAAKVWRITGNLYVKTLQYRNC